MEEGPHVESPHAAVRPSTLLSSLMRRRARRRTSLGAGRSLLVGVASLSIGAVVVVGVAGRACRTRRPPAIVGLQQGSRGDAVRSLQQALVAAGVIVTGGVDGIFGVGTAAAVKQFQSAKGLSATGVVDDATAAALAGRPGARRSPSSPLFGLKIGATGDAVRQLQATLVAHGFKTKGDADGTFGVNTVNALASFQYEKRIKVNGQGRRGNPRRPRHPRPRTRRRRTGRGTRGGPVEPVVRPQDRRHRRRRAPTPSDARRPRLQDQRRRRRHLRRQHRQRPRQLPVRQADQGQRPGSTRQPSPPSAPQPPYPPPHQPQPRGGGLGFAAYGERGGRVTTLQRALINAGITVRGGADGIFGSGTAAAVMAFQKAKGIPATGVVDQATAQALALTPGAAPAVAEARRSRCRRSRCRASASSATRGTCRAAPVGCTKAPTSAPPRASTCTPPVTAGSRSSTWSAPTSSPGTA